MRAQISDSVFLEYESFGKPDDPAVLLIMGLGAQMLRWNDGICTGLAAAGYRVIRFDNRDCGLSSHFDASVVPAMGEVMAALQAGRVPGVPYTLEDMADDGAGLLDALGIARAHIVGISMGGAIAQIMAVRHAARVCSLTCLMATSGNPLLPGPTPTAAAALFSPLPRDRSRESMVADGMRRYRAVCSPGYPVGDGWLADLLGREFDRSFHPQGVARQLAAILANGDRGALLPRIRVPTLVLHGADDPLIPPACGEDIAQRVPGATFRSFPGMGHDLPPALDATLVAAIVTHLRPVP